MFSLSDLCWFYSNLFVCVCVYGFIWKWKPWSVVTSSISSVPSFSIHIRVKCCHKLLTSLWRVWQRFSTIYDRFYCFGWKHLILYCYGYIIIRLIIIVFDHWFENHSIHRKCCSTKTTHTQTHELCWVHFVDNPSQSLWSKCVECKCAICFAYEWKTAPNCL